MRKYTQIFPNNNATLAYYDPFSQLINLCFIDQVKFENYQNKRIINEDSLYANSIYAHELTHWFDHNSSIWGQENLVLLYNAINARLTNNTNEFWRIKYYYDHCKTESQSSYYTQIKNPEYDLFNVKDWGLMKIPSARFDIHGKVNNSKPLLHIQIINRDETEIARIPLTIAALLECRAIEHEFEIRANTIKSFFKESDREGAFLRLNEDLNQVLFDPNMILYNIVFHLTGFAFSSYDLSKVLYTANLISNIALNFPKSCLSQLKKIRRKETELQNRYDLLLNNFDRSFIFYTILENTAEAMQFEDDVNIEKILKHSNLPKKEEFKELIAEEMKSNLDNLIDGPLLFHAQKIISNGIQLNKDKALEDYIFLSFPSVKKEFVPKVMYEKSHFPKSSSESLEELIQNEHRSFEQHYYLFEFMKEKVYEFVDACGI